MKGAPLPYRNSNSLLFDSQAMRLLSLKEVVRITCIARATIYKKIKAGDFPAPLKISSTCVRWRSDEIDRWVEKLTNER
ncbi:AlpA family phage regulatory protein [Brucella sp. NBRC 14130]|uniref:helix-turn-helix transcriptional regulator n=1 Tax=Brucella sp. NBRC 14130 TaxID=3075483 RepID=UPI00333F5C60